MDTFAMLTLLPLHSGWLMAYTRMSLFVDK